MVDMISMHIVNHHSKPNKYIYTFIIVKINFKSSNHNMKLQTLQNLWVVEFFYDFRSQSQKWVQNLYLELLHFTRFCRTVELALIIREIITELLFKNSAELHPTILKINNSIS